MIKVLHAKAAHVLDEGLDFFIFLHILVTGVVNIHHVRHKAARKEIGVLSQI